VIDFADDEGSEHQVERVKINGLGEVLQMRKANAEVYGGVRALRTSVLQSVQRYGTEMTRNP
jgi:hypothetical protein